MNTLIVKLKTSINNPGLTVIGAELIRLKVSQTKYVAVKHLVNGSPTNNEIKVVYDDGTTTQMAFTGNNSGLSKAGRIEINKNYLYSFTAVSNNLNEPDLTLKLKYCSKLSSLNINMNSSTDTALNVNELGRLINLKSINIRWNGDKFTGCIDTMVRSMLDYGRQFDDSHREIFVRAPSTVTYEGLTNDDFVDTTDKVCKIVLTSASSYSVYKLDGIDETNGTYALAKKWKKVNGEWVTE